MAATLSLICLALFTGVPSAPQDEVQPLENKALGI
jgi:hypothetical protein